MKTIGIIGAGRIARAFTRQLVKSGFNVIISNSRGPGSLKSLVTDMGPRVRAGTTCEAAQAEIVILAVQWAQVVEALANLPCWDGRIVIDATNRGINLDPVLKVTDLGEATSSEFIQGLVPGARLVKAFNTIYYKIVENHSEQLHGRRVVFISGDDKYAKRHCSQLIRQLGFEPVDLGGLAYGGRLHQIGGPLSQLNLIQARC